MFKMHARVCVLKNVGSVINIEILFCFTQVQEDHLYFATHIPSCFSLGEINKMPC